MKLKILDKKKILFLSPFFFNYENVIKKKMEEMGAEVKFYNERSVTSALDRAILKFCPCVFKNKSEKYYQQIIEENIGIDFDYIFIVKCDMVTSRILKEFRNRFSNAKLCLYLWDSIENIPDIESKMGLFDFASSFDREDCKKNKLLKFRPLFYADNFYRENADSNFKYDVCFCGTIHSDRYRIMNMIKKECCRLGLSSICFCYLQSKFMFYLFKIIGSGFKSAKIEEFSFVKKTLSEIEELENESKVIIDIQHPKQTGLTMRTIEMLGLKKKFITTNSDIVNYDFYDPNNILVVDRNKPFITKEFIDAPYNIKSQKIYRRYSLEQWILDVLDHGGNNYESIGNGG